MLPSDETLKTLGKSLDNSRDAMEKLRSTMELSNTLLRTIIGELQKGAAPGR